MSANDYERRHAKRYALSLAALKPHLTPGMEVLECGGAGKFTTEIVAELGVHVLNTHEDLRYPAMRDANTFDCVLCMEVFEHIHDRDAEMPTEWYGNGAKWLLAHLFDVLKPGGLLFLTTPNAASLNVLHKVLSQLPPMVYRPHVREYAPHELAGLVGDAGFKDIAVTSHDSWDNDCMSKDEAKKLRETIKALGYREDCRGEDLFLLARKPARAPA